MHSNKEKLKRILRGEDTPLPLEGIYYDPEDNKVCKVNDGNAESSPVITICWKLKEGEKPPEHAKPFRLLEQLAPDMLCIIEIPPEAKNF